MWSGVQRGVPGQAGLPGGEDRVGGLVQLQPAGVRGGLAVQQPVARERPVGQLHVIEQVPDHLPGGGEVAVGQEPGERLVGVAREDLAVGAEVRRQAVAGRSARPAPPGPTGWPARPRWRPRNVLSSLALITLALTASTRAQQRCVVLQRWAALQKSRHGSRSARTGGCRTPTTGLVSGKGGGERCGRGT